MTKQLLEIPPASQSPIGVIGFSLGCSFALEAARRDLNDVRAVVLFYGTGGGKFDRIQASILGYFAEHDAWGAQPRNVRSLETRCEQAGVAFEYHTYPGTEHWFFEDDRPNAYNPTGASLAWNRTLTFLRENLVDPADQGA